MHEISLIRNIFSTLESTYSVEDLATLTTIDLKIGVLSNVEPILLQNAFHAVTSAEKKFEDVKLNVELVAIEIYCEDCCTKSKIENYRFVCDICKKPCNNLLTGTELQIQQVHFTSDGT